MSDKISNMTDSELIEFYNNLIKSQCQYYSMGIYIHEQEEIYKILKPRIDQALAKMETDIVIAEKRINQLYVEIERLKKND